MIVFDVYGRSIFWESLLWFGVYPGEFRDYEHMWYDTGIYFAAAAAATSIIKRGTYVQLFLSPQCFRREHV